ncbi:unnamed protein product [Microthlaspi erraticum]|uniref:Uncharacterized protein n=1 Tax=Microthlaspi erraticum TaxID=1685480 RepID=A0A6D2HZV8_9BRAS|nr:unnamed protein product [Microthlaspi erraticum]
MNALMSLSSPNGVASGGVKIVAAYCDSRSDSSSVAANDVRRDLLGLGLLRISTASSLDFDGATLLSPCFSA